MVLCVIFGGLRLYEKYEDKKLYSYLVEQAKKSTNHLSGQTKKSNILGYPVELTIEKANDLTLKQMIRFAQYPAHINLQEYESKMAELLCNEKKMGLYIGVGLAHQFYIYDQNGSERGSFVIDKKNCTAKFNQTWIGAAYSKK